MPNLPIRLIRFVTNGTGKIMKKMLFVYNPYAGKGQIKNKLSEIINSFVKHEYEVTVYPTQKVLDGYEFVKKKEGCFDVVVCSGGDGTLDEIVSATAEYSGEKPVIGYIPTGSTNDFASSLGIPRNMLKAAEIIGENKIFECDIGKMNGRFFNYVAAFGAFTEVTYTTPQKMKNILGYPAYVLESLKYLPKIKAYHMKIVIDGTTEVYGRFIFGMVSNSVSVGGLKRLPGKKVSLNDGTFEILLVREPDNPIEFSEMLAGIFNDKNNITVEKYKASRVKFECTEEVAWTLDGENGGSFTKTNIEVVNKAVKIFSPKGN